MPIVHCVRNNKEMRFLSGAFLEPVLLADVEFEMITTGLSQIKENLTSQRQTLLGIWEDQQEEDSEDLSVLLYYLSHFALIVIKMTIKMTIKKTVTSLYVH